MWLNTPGAVLDGSTLDDYTGKSGELELGPTGAGLARDIQFVGTRRFSSSNQCWTTIRRAGLASESDEVMASGIRKRWSSSDMSYERPDHEAKKGGAVFSSLAGALAIHVVRGSTVTRISEPSIER